MLSPFFDFIMAGGGSIITLLVIMCAISIKNNTVREITGMTMLGLSFFINWPHFMLSYQLLYRNFLKKIAHFYLTDRSMYWRYINAGIIIPLFLLLFIWHSSYAMFYYGSTLLISYGLGVMYLTVGWHYIKQAFGVFIVLSTLRQVYYKPWQRSIFLWNGYIVWFFSYVYPRPIHKIGDQQTISSFKYIDSIYYNFPEWLGILALIASIVGTLAVIGVLVYTWNVEKKHPSLAGVIGYFSMYYWLGFMGWEHPLWLLIAPFFHSLQYIMFVAAYRRGQMYKEIDKLKKSENNQQANEIKPIKKIHGRYQVFFAYAFLLGILFFFVIPGMADFYLHQYNKVWSLGLFIFLFAIFINIHHYFIDNVIWRKENSDVGEYFFKW